MSRGLRDRRQWYDIQKRKYQQQTMPIDEEEFNRTEKSKISYPCWLFLDQATNVGYCIFDNESRLIISGVADTDNKKISVQQFAHEFSDMLDELIEEFKIETIFYEEVYNEANERTTEVLYYIKHKITDKSYGRDNLMVYPLDHRKWKNLLAGGDKYNFDKDNKKETEKFVSEIYPLIPIIADHESDALGMGIAVMIREKNRKNLWKITRYNKKLPIETKVMDMDINEGNVEDLIKNKKLIKPFRDAYEAGGFYELELDRAVKIETTIKKFLSHKDVLLKVKIPKTYKYWGYMLLVAGINPDNLTTEDESFIYLVARKRRL